MIRHIKKKHTQWLSQELCIKAGPSDRAGFMLAPVRLNWKIKKTCLITLSRVKRPNSAWLMISLRYIHKNYDELNWWLRWIRSRQQLFWRCSNIVKLIKMIHKWNRITKTNRTSSKRSKNVCVDANLHTVNISNSLNLRIRQMFHCLTFVMHYILFIIKSTNNLE